MSWGMFAYQEIRMVEETRLGEPWQGWEQLGPRQHMKT